MGLEKRILEQLPIGVALTTFEGRLLRANPAAYELLGIEPTVKGLDVTTLYPDPEERAAIVASVRSNENKRHEVHLYVNGVSVLFRSMNVAFWADDGRGVILSAFWRA
jgi:PAS domain-containing protein